MAKKKQQELVIFKGKNGQVKLRGDFHNETIWATQAEIAKLFGAERSVITKHIGNIFKDGELQEDSVCANLHILPVMEKRIKYKLIISTLFWL